MDYSRYENISIDNYGALYSFKDSNFYNFCSANNLKNLKEIFEFLDKNEVQVKNSNSRAEILGIIDILKYVYLNQSISYFDKLYTECDISSLKHSYCSENIFFSRYEYFIRRLGFSKNETHAIASKMNYNETIGDAIVALYKDMLLKPHAFRIYRDYLVRLKKLELFVNYYKYNKATSNYLDNLTKEIEKLKNERDLLNQKIAEKEFEISIIKLNKGNSKIKTP